MTKKIKCFKNDTYIFIYMIKCDLVVLKYTYIEYKYEYLFKHIYVRIYTVADFPSIEE